jgi:hypothetical protein
VGSVGPVSSFAMAAAACFLRGTAGRPQDAVRLSYAYIVDRGNDGFDFFYPVKDPDSDLKCTRKGHSDADARHLVMPEVLDDGFPIALKLQEFLIIAPKVGPLFQKTTAVGGWSGKGWSAACITDKLRKALADARLGLFWLHDQIYKYSSHSFRSTTATSMACGGVNTEIVAKSLHHKSTSVTSRHYIAPSKDQVRHNLGTTKKTRVSAVV